MFVRVSSFCLRPSYISSSFASKEVTAPAQNEKETDPTAKINMPNIRSYKLT